VDMDIVEVAKLRLISPGPDCEAVRKTDGLQIRHFNFYSRFTIFGGDRSSEVTKKSCRYSR
jgi:hypothetical protein